jgi:hypothetical protein
LLIVRACRRNYEQANATAKEPADEVSRLAVDSKLWRVGIIFSLAVTGDDMNREKGNPYAIRLLAWPARWLRAGGSTTGASYE